MGGREENSLSLNPTSTSVKFDGNFCHQRSRHPELEWMIHKVRWRRQCLTLLTLLEKQRKEEAMVVRLTVEHVMSL
jgi:hypothetical protein